MNTSGYHQMNINYAQHLITTLQKTAVRHLRTTTMKATTTMKGIPLANSATQKREKPMIITNGLIRQTTESQSTSTVFKAGK